MRWVGRFFAVPGALLLAAFPVAASAQDGRLRLPTIAVSTAAAADWASTYHGLKHYHVREANPLLQPWRDSPGKLISMGAVMDAGAVTAWNLTMGRKRPDVAMAGLWAMTAFRTYLAIQNLRNQGQSLRRRSRPSTTDAPEAGGGTKQHRQENHRELALQKQVVLGNVCIEIEEEVADLWR